MRRRDFLREIIRGPVSKTVGVVLTILGTIATVREFAVPETAQAKLNFYRIWSLDWPWWLWTIVLLFAALVILFEGAYRIVRDGRQQSDAKAKELRDRIAILEAVDVTLEGTFPAPFTLHARGHACEIRTGPIVQESGVLGVHKDGERTMQLVSQRYEIEFPVESDLRDGDKEVAPSLLIGEGYRRGAWPEKGAKRSGMEEFFRNAERLRRVAIGEPDTGTSTPVEMDDFAERIRRTMTFAFNITFWNSERTQQWRRSELLVYEPTTGRAFVRHAGAPVLISDSVRQDG